MSSDAKNRAGGFTIIELLVSMAILALISVYLTGMLTQQNRAYTVVDQVTEAQSNQRAIAQILEREVRATGGLVWEGASICGVDNVGAPDILYVTDMDSLQMNSSLNYELGATVESGFDGSGTDLIRLASMNLDGAAYYDLDDDGVGDADFKDGAGVIVMDSSNPDRGVVCGQIMDVDFAARTIQVDFTDAVVNLRPVPPVRPEPTLVAVPAHRYTVDPLTLEMTRDDMILADDVEDFQVAYRFDGTDEDMLIDPALDRGSVGNPVYEANELSQAGLREVQIGFVTRSRRTDPRLTGATFQNLHNRAAVPGTDGFRRRPYTSTIRVRNVGHRWYEEG
jgi:prepilin-type N-terminal cleavage/methylation domain-containing protein